MFDEDIFLAGIGRDVARRCIPSLDSTHTHTHTRARARIARRHLKIFIYLNIVNK